MTTTELAHRAVQSVVEDANGAKVLIVVVAIRLTDGDLEVAIASNDSNGNGILEAALQAGIETLRSGARERVTVPQ